MRVKKLLLITIAALLCFSCATVSENKKQENVNTEVSPKLKKTSRLITGKFNNGMNYNIESNNSPANTIVLKLVVKTGSCMEDEDQKGVAHFIEHMAFNATENLKQNEIISYLESAGMENGRDINAETSQTTTVYIAKVPATKAEYLEKAMVWLSDIASGKILFLPEEIEKEKGIVIEEWRRSLGFNKSFEENVLNEWMLKNSRFAIRPVLGTETSIRDVSRERVIDYYNKWYRPDNMSLVIVGPVDFSMTKKVIKKHFGSIPKVKTTLPSVDLSVPEQNKGIKVFHHESLKTTQIQIFERFTKDYVIDTEQDIKNNFIKYIASRAFNQRIDSLCRDKNCPITSGSFDYTYYRSKDNYYHYLYWCPKDGRIEDSVKMMLDEWNRIKKYGITENEFKYLLNIVITDNEAYNNNPYFDSTQKTNNIIDSLLYGYPYYGSEDIIPVSKKVIHEITIDDINNYYKGIFNKNPDFIMELAPENNTNSISEEQLKSLIYDYKSDVTAYVDDFDDRPIMEKPSAKGNVISTNKNEELETTEYVFENGLKIITKKTTYSKNSLSFFAYSEGGLSVFEDDFYPSACAANRYVINSGINGFTRDQYVRKLPSTLSLNIGIYKYYSFFEGNCNTNDLETLMQVIAAFMTKPEFSDDAWNKIYEDYVRTEKKRGMTKEDIVNIKVNSILYGDDIRNNGVTEKFVQLLDKEKSKESYIKSFSNPADFTFTFAGTFDEEALIELCSYYLGNIPGDVNNTNKVILRETDFPKGINKETVEKGKETNSNVYLIYGDKLKEFADVSEKQKKNELYYAVRNYLGKKLNDTVREKFSGTYKVGGNIVVQLHPAACYTSEINFGCEPGREEELIKIVMDEIEYLKNTPISDEELNQLKQAYSYNFNKNKFINSWWVQRINRSLIYGLECPETAKNENLVLDWYTKENIQECFNELFDKNNYVLMIQKPESQKE